MEESKPAMNKYVVLIIVLGVMIAGGIAYRAVRMSDVANRPVETGVVREITIRIPKDTWSFDPESIEVNQGDRVKLTFVNEDDYDHGVGIDAYGVSQRVPARATLPIPEFVVTKSGDFQFYCSVSCNDGVAMSGKYQGQKRGHFDQIGVLRVKAVAGAVTVGDEPKLPDCTGVAKPATTCVEGEQLTCVNTLAGTPGWECRSIPPPAPVSNTMPAPGFEGVPEMIVEPAQ